MKKIVKKAKKIIIILLFIIIALDTHLKNKEDNQSSNIIESNNISYEIFNIPNPNGEIYIEINNNNPKFSEKDLEIEKDYYSKLKNGKVRNGYDKNKLEKSKQR